MSSSAAFGWWSFGALETYFVEDLVSFDFLVEELVPFGGKTDMQGCGWVPVDFQRVASGG